VIQALALFMLEMHEGYRLTLMQTDANMTTVSLR
jgi:hypothetical protein